MATVLAPFGIRTNRFSPIGFHPGLDPTGSLRADRNKLGPGQYDPEAFVCPYKKYNTAGSIWKRKTATEEFSRQLGYRNEKILHERLYYKSVGGPGNYDVSEDLFKKKSCSVLRDVNFGNQRRFFQLTQNVPPPGTYDKDVVKSSTVLRKQMTPLPPFEWDGFVDRFKRPSRSWMRPPNIYDPKDGKTIEDLLGKVVSKKGPYKLFTGPRDDTTIHNHFARGASCTPDKYYSWPNGLDFLLHHPSKQRCGAVLKEKRFPKRPTVRMLMDDLTTCYKDPNSPSPATYDIHTEGIIWMPEGKHPFNDSKRVARKGAQWMIRPGPGRYEVGHRPCKHTVGRETWVFKSTTGRSEYKPPNYCIF